MFSYFVHLKSNYKLYLGALFIFLREFTKINTNCFEMVTDKRKRSSCNITEDKVIKNPIH